MKLSIPLFFIFFISRLVSYEEGVCFLPYGYNPPETFTNDCCTWVGSFEVLYWRPYQEGLTAVKIAVPQQLSQNHTMSFLKDTLRHGDFCLPWDYGYRLVGGLDLPCDRFGVLLSYTHFLECDHEVFSANYLNRVLFSPGFNVLNFQIPTQGLTQHRFSHISLNKIDLTLERSLFLGPHLVIRPSLGLSAVLLEEKFQLQTYSSELANANTFQSFFLSNSFVRGRFNGVGPTLALKTSWDLGCGLEAIGGGVFGVLFGAFKTELQIDSSGFLTADLTSNNLSIDYPFHRDSIRSFSEIFIGLGWKYLFQDGKRLIMLKAGWEQLTLYNQGFFPQVQLANSLPDEPSLTLQPTESFLVSDLSFAGFFISASLYF